MTTPSPTSDVVARALALYRRDNCSCSQAVAACIGPEVGIDEATAMSITRAFGGGIARNGLTCGAVVSAIMILGVHAGRIAPDDVKAKSMAYDLARAFTERFKACHGGIECKELLGFDISSEEGRNRNAGNKVSSRVCPKYVGDASVFTMELIERTL